MALEFRTAHEAADAFVTPVAQFLASLTKPPQHVHGPRRQGSHQLVLARGLPAPLRLQASSPDHELELRSVVYYTVAARPEEGWQVTVDGYVHELYQPDVSRIIGWHWHPETTPEGPLHHHVHVSDLSDGYERSHFPTRGFRLLDLGGFLIEEYGLTPGGRYAEASLGVEWIERIGQTWGLEI